MPKRRIFWRLYRSYLVVALVALLAVTLLAHRAVYSFYLGQVGDDLESRAILVREHLDEMIGREPDGKIDGFCKLMGRQSATRITVIEETGRVIGESDEDLRLMRNHSNRPEIRAALRGRTGTDIRLSDTLQRRMKYVAIPVWRSEGDRTTPIAVIRTSMPIATIHDALRSIRLEIALGGLIVLVLIAGVSVLVSRRISRPLEHLKEVAESFARGDLGRRVRIPDLDEIGSLAETMNQMAAELDGEIRAVTEQRNEREAILLSMAEGVLAVDRNERVVSMNRACAEMLGVDEEAVRGKSMQEGLRHADLQTFVLRTLAGEQEEDEIILHIGADRRIRASGAPLRDAGGEDVGAVIILNDVTRLRRLEKIRREFVANVSHELKTPITTITSAVETLQDGAVGQPDDAERFMQVIARQTARMNAIVEDLLGLSRIEEDGADIALAERAVRGPIEAAAEACRERASRVGVTIEINCDGDLRAAIDPALIENALVNLVDNAVKHSNEGMTVRIEADRTNDEVAISVRDEGCGIEKKHLPRIFERFYRVDKGRSRRLGGTGLGLSIVKHIAQVHGGYVDVESEPGRGSSFTIHLPRPSSA